MTAQNPATASREHACRAIRSSRLARLEAQLTELLLPSIRLGVSAVEQDALALGASRFGGMPDMPATLAWPIFADRPMALVAQLSMAELVGLDSQQLLPQSGWLYFFFDASNEAPFEESDDDARCWRVLYHDGPVAELARIEPPEPRHVNNEFRPFALGYRVEQTLPSYGSTLLDEVMLDDAQQADYEKLSFSLNESPPLPGAEKSSTLQRGLGRIHHWLIGDPIHRVLGHPEHFQLDPRVDWQRLEEHRSVVTTPDQHTQQAAREWLLLLQADTFKEGPDWLWGDNATLYFGIRREDLAARNFSAVQWTIECG